MKLKPGMRSDNVQDRRGAPRGRGRAIAGGGGLIAVVLLIASVFFPREAQLLMRLLGGGDSGGGQSVQEAPIDDAMNRFVGVTLGYTEDFWAEAFRNREVPAARGRYQPATLVLFSGGTGSGCGAASSASGPFYCPADKKIYIDPAFFQVMARKLNAPGDFAQAYVIAHEVAHHVQNLTGVLRQVHQLKLRSGNRIQGNRLTVRVELQADCYSGVWARRTDAKHDILEEGDLREALRAAYQVGDDILQRMSTGRVDEREFTHGSAEQRARWFRRGYESGDLGACETFQQPYETL